MRRECAQPGEALSEGGGEGLEALKTPTVQVQSLHSYPEQRILGSLPPAICQLGLIFFVIMSHS